MLWNPWKRVWQLEAARTAQDAHVERLEHELLQLRADFNSVVAMLGNMATRPLGKGLMGDEDLFKEDDRLLDTYLTPAPDETIEMERLTDLLNDEGR